MERPSVLLKACLNGARSREDHDAVPLTPDELAADALAAADAGAAAVHVHPRADDGSETLEGRHCDAAVVAIRETRSSLPIGLTTGAWVEPDLERRLAAIRSWRAKPDFASVNLAEDGVVDVAHVLLDAGIAIEAGLFTAEHVHALSDSGLADRCLRVLVEVGDSEPDAAVEAAASIEEALGTLGVKAPQLHHGFGSATWAVIERAASRGHGVRVGLEDTLTLPDGRPARDNAELVDAARQLIGR